MNTKPIQTPARSKPSRFLPPTPEKRWLSFLITLLLPVIILMLGQSSANAQRVQLIHQTNTVWKYHPNTADPGYVPADAWTAIGFDDSSWPSGVGYFGQEGSMNEYSDPNVNYVSCLCGQNTFIAAPGSAGGVASYFRTHINWTNGSPGGVEFLFTNYVDDSVVVYLNGNVLFTFNVSAAKPLPMLWNDANPSGTANPLGEGVPFVTNVVATGLQAGDNVLAVQLQQQGSGSSDDVFTTILWATIPQPLAISIQPTNQTIAENHAASLTVGVTGTRPFYQWYKGTVSPIAVADGTNAILLFTNALVADSGDYFAIITNAVNSVTSQVAHLSIVNDTNGPVLLRISADDSFQRILLTWDETVLQGPAIESGSYFIQDPAGNSVNVSSVDYNGSNVVLHVPTMLRDTNYTIEIDYQQDLVGNPTKPVGMPQIDPANGIATGFRTWTITRGLTKFQAYLGLPAGQNIAQFVNMPIYPNSPTFSFATNLVYWPQTAPNVEQYAMRFSGLYIASESGTHHFNPDHDDEARLRFYASESPNDTFTEVNPACCTGLLDGPTLDVDLVAGNMYYYELIVREFGGGDHAGFSVTMPSSTVVSPVSGAYLAIAADPLAAPNFGISVQPQNQTIAENHPLTFSVTVTNAGGSIAYQWQRQPSGGGGFTDIPGALGPSYTTPLLTLANNNDQYRVIVSVPGKTITSSAATATVIVDNTKPLALSAHGNRGLNAVVVTFNEAMASGPAVNPANYSVVNTNGTPLTVGAPTLSADLMTVTIPTSGQTAGDYYTVHIQGVTDVAGNAIVATNIIFQTWVLSPGFVLFEAYNTGGGNAVSDLTGNVNYPNNPDLVAYLPTFDSRNVYPTDSREGYGARISGFFIAPATSNYIFYLRSDDASEFWMNTNAVNSTDPAGKSKLQEETGCCNAFSVHPTTNPPPSLVGGQAYYLELLYKEGTGGDFGQAAFKASGDPRNPDTLTPIPGAYLATLADPVGASVTITQQPQNKTFVISTGATVLVTETFNASDAGYTVSNPTGAFEGPWAYNAARGSWQESGQNADNGHPNTSLLDSTTYTVTAFGNVLLNLTHRWSFEHDGTAWDGGQIRMSRNGGAFTAVPAAAFIQNGYNGSVAGGSSSQLSGQPAFIAESAGYASGYVVSIANLGLFNPGDTLRIEFFAASDSNTRGQVPNWEIDQVALTQGSSEPNVTFSIGAIGTITSSSNPPKAYQWYRNNGGGWVAIAGASSATYSFVPTLADNGAQFRVVVYVPGASATSTAATLTVTSGGGTQPTLRRTYANGTLTLSWDAPARLQFATSLTPPINWRDVDTGGATTYAIVLSNEFTVNLDAAQEGSPIGLRTGIGSGSVTLSNNVLLVDVVYSGLSGNRNNDHFHAPAARGVNAGIAYDLASISTGTTSGTIKGAVPLVNGQYGGKTIPQQIGDLRNSLWYLNIHSTTFGSGEIRGQVEPGARFYRLISP